MADIFTVRNYYRLQEARRDGSRWATAWQAATVAGGRGTMDDDGGRRRRGKAEGDDKGRWFSANGGRWGRAGGKRRRAHMVTRHSGRAVPRTETKFSGQTQVCLFVKGPSQRCIRPVLNISKLTAKEKNTPRASSGLEPTARAQ